MKISLEKKPSKIEEIFSEFGKGIPNLKEPSTFEEIFQVEERFGHLFENGAPKATAKDIVTDPQPHHNLINPKIKGIAEDAFRGMLHAEMTRGKNPIVTEDKYAERSDLLSIARLRLARLGPKPDDPAKAKTWATRRGVLAEKVTEQVNALDQG